METPTQTALAAETATTRINKGKSKKAKGKRWARAPVGRIAATDVKEQENPQFVFLSFFTFAFLLLPF
jgi:hypothetical protein